MADVQVEHGYTRLANELLEALARAELPGRHFRVMLAMIRLTYGFNKAEDRIAASQLAEVSGVPLRSVRNVVQELERAGMLLSKDAAGHIPLRRVQKDHEKWEPLPSQNAAHGRKHPTRERGPYTGTTLHGDVQSTRESVETLHGNMEPPLHGNDTHQRHKKKTKDTRGVAAAGPSKSELLKARPPKPSHPAIAIFCEEYKTARGVTPVVPDRDKRELGVAFADMDLEAERLRAALRVFFRLDDDWCRELSYSARAFLSRLTQCDVRAQKAASRAPPPGHSEDPQITADPVAFFPRSTL